MQKSLNNLAIIPARGSSKRIPKKNIKLFNGVPIINYSIDAAIGSQLFSEVMVSTDSHEVAQLATDKGCSVPFLRSAKNSDDNAIIADVIIEVLSAYEKMGKTYDYVCCILATSPFIEIRRLNEAYNKLIYEGFDSVVTFVKYSVPIQQAFKIMDNSRVEMFFNDKYGVPTQNLIQSYYDAGQFYWMRPESVREKRRISCENTGAVILSELAAHDIDTEEDWHIAEFKFKYWSNMNEHR